ncbi:MAG: hypothetical protein WCG27_02080 [Pseudomonadota bacterium]
MMIYRLKKFPIPQQSPIKKDTRFYVSRQALKECLMEMALEDHFLTWADLEITGHHHLKKRADLLVSLSHTGPYGAAVVAVEKPILSVGIDVELLKRSCPTTTAKFFVNEMDNAINSDLLSLWSAKEAAYKAIDPLLLGEMTLKKIWIRGNQFGLFPALTLLGEVIRQEHQLEGETILVTLAKLLRMP